MGDLFVVPLCLGHIIRDKSLFTLHKGIGEKLTLPIASRFICGAEATIIVDKAAAAELKRSYSDTPHDLTEAVAYIKRQKAKN